MNETVDAPLSPETVSRIRHDLRTFVNHILGYGDMMLEVARDEGPEQLLADLEAIPALGHTMLAQIGDGLPPGREDLRVADVEKLRIVLLPPQRELQRHLTALETQIAALGAEEFAGDVEKVGAALFNMDRFLHQDPRIMGGEHKASPLPSSDVQPGDAVVGSARILVVDDVANNRDMLYRRLTREGYAVEQAANGNEALQRLALGGLDLMLLDILMPEVDGFEVLRQAKANPAWRDVPIIMISSLDEIQSVVRCIEMGAEDFLPKPFDPVILRARVSASLEQKRLRDQELAYLRSVNTVMTAASALEAGQFDPGVLDEIALRTDALGQLARVFQRMGREVQAREQRLKHQVQQLKIEIDESRKKTQVAEVTESEYFQDLQKRAETLRSRARKMAGGKDA